MKDTIFESNLRRRIEKLIRFHSISSRPAELKACAKWIKKELEKNLSKQLKQKKVQIEMTLHNNVPSILAVQGKWKHPKILLNGHFDVVPGTDSQFKPVTVDDKIYGRGAADMKAGVASLMTSFIHAVSKRSDLSVGLVLTGDEEVGGENGVGQLVQDGWKTDLLINFDGGYCEEISHAEKGFVRLVLRAEGKTAQVQNPWEGNCALDPIVEAYNRLVKLFPGRQKATLTDNWHTTFSPKKIVTAPNGNSIIHYTELHISIHFVENKTPKEIVNMVRSKMPKEVQVESIYEVPRVYVNPNHPELKKFQKLYGTVLGHEPAIREENGSSDARYFSNLNIPVIITKPNSGNAEQENEWVSFRSVYALTQAVEEYLILHQ